MKGAAKMKTKKLPKYRGLVGTGYRELSHMIADPVYGTVGTSRVLLEALQQGDAAPSDFSIRPLFEVFVPGGREYLQEYHSGGLSTRTANLLESGVVKSSQFANITGQIVYSETLKYYEDEEFVFTKEVPNMPSKFLGPEKIAGIGRIGDTGIEAVPEGMPFPYVSPVEDFVHAPSVEKRGEICSLSWEVVYSDRTSDLLQRASELGHWMGYEKEKRIIDCFVDEGAGAKSAMAGGFRYHWRDTSYATHQATTPWVNIKTSNALVDWTDIEAAELILSRIVDQNTGAVIMIDPDCLVVTKQLEYTARYIIQATSLAINTGGYATSGTPTRFEMANFLPKYKIITSRLLETRMATDTDWYLANIKKMMRYKECQPLQTEQAPDNFPDNFTRKIVSQWMCWEAGAPFVFDPRFVCESRA